MPLTNEKKHSYDSFLIIIISSDLLNQRAKYSPFFFYLLEV